MRTAVLFAGLLALLTWACQNGPTSFDEQSVITMQKTECFGTCPVYTVRIQGDGVASLEGVRHLDKIGTYRRQLGPEETSALFTAFLDAPFNAFRSEYSSDATDLPTTYLTFENGGKEKKVKNYDGAPQALTDLENRVAKVVAAAGWEKLSGEAPHSDAAALVKRGEYLVTISGCHDCHSPKIFTERGPESDPERLLSGHPADMPVGKFDPAIMKDWALFNHHLTAAVGPWGVSFAANLTSDPSGIGTWSEEQFFRALREGKYKGLEGSRPLLPPMPWPNFAQMSDEDLRAVFAYLKSTRPIHNIVPAPVPPTALSMK